MTDLLVATTNPGKFSEVQAFLEKLPLQIVSLKALISPPHVIEDGRTFAENALKKARTFARFSGLPTLADDSGLEVDASTERRGFTLRVMPVSRGMTRLTIRSCLANWRTFPKIGALRASFARLRCAFRKQPA